MSSPKIEQTLGDGLGLFLVYEPEYPLRAVCDIVAVHGMGGGAASTWRHNKTQFLWLRDSLPSILKDLPYGISARIWTFGYDSSVAFQLTFPGVHVFSEPLLEHCAVNRIGEDGRKVIFIAHSLGGVVVKSVLFDAAAKGSELVEATIGVLFLATAHRVAHKGHFVASVAQLFGVKLTPSELEQVKRNGAKLWDKADEFPAICSQMRISSFYETRAIGSFGLLVDKESAVMDVECEERVPLLANHISISRFEDAGDGGLELVQGSINRMMERGCVQRRVNKI